MAINVNIGGTVYVLAETGERSWGSNMTSLIQALSTLSGKLYAGSSSLSADHVLSGAGLEAPYYKASGVTSIPSAGAVRLGHTDAIGWIDFAGTGAKYLVPDASGDTLTYGGVDLVSSESVGTSAGAQPGSLQQNIWDGATAAAYSVALGNKASASAAYSIAIGGDDVEAEAAIASAAKSIAIGNNSEASASLAVAIGVDCSASQSASMALGYSSVSDYELSSAIGYAAATDKSYQVMLGGSASSIKVGGKDLVLPVHASAPASPETGSSYYDSTDEDVQVYDGSGWISVGSAAVATHAALTTTHGISGALVGTSDTQTLTNKKITGGSASTTNEWTLPAKADQTSLSSVAGNIMFDTTTSKATVYNGAEWKAIGGGLVVEEKSASFTAEAGKHYIIDSTGGAVTVTLPSGAVEDVIRFSDAGETWATENNVTLDPAAGKSIDGNAADENFVLDVDGAWVQIMADSSGNWVLDTAEFLSNVGLANTSTPGLIALNSDYAATSTKFGLVTSSGGQYSPSITNKTSVDTVTATNLSYSIIGETLFVSGSVTIDTAGATGYSFDMALPSDIATIDSGAGNALRIANSGGEYFTAVSGSTVISCVGEILTATAQAHAFQGQFHIATFN